MTELELRILDFEATHHHPAGKDAAVQREFGITSARYYQIVWSLIDRPDVLEARPMVVHRLRRIRANATKRRLARLR
jgi:hypothetical protein